jgi:hypothetical protein
MTNRNCWATSGSFHPESLLLSAQSDFNRSNYQDLSISVSDML